jgi:6-pyruvoyltetrahydropterin/6-carboxytetrahydropterin synthase
MANCTKRIEFDYGHRVLGHKGKCNHLHGHRGVAEITCSSRSLDDLGVVIDFAIIKQVVGAWIDEHWDHNLILNADDPILYHKEVFAGKEPYVMPDERNPTAEELAHLLFLEAGALLAVYGVKVSKVRFYETPTSYSEYPD